MDELISIIIPAFNVSRFIEAAVQSALDQTYKNTEIVVVDDCSKDDTVAKLAGFRDKIKVLQHERNQGAAEARNTGVRQCRGNLIAFLDGDDKWAPGKLEIFAESFSAFPGVQFAFSDFSRFEWSDGSFFALSNSQIYPSIYSAIQGQKYTDRRNFLIPKTDMFSMLLDGYPIYPSAIVVRKCVFEKIGMWRKIRTNEDFDFGLRSCRVTDFLYIDEKLAMVGRHDANLTVDIQRQMEGNISVIDLHLNDSTYSNKELDLIKNSRGRRLCGLGYTYHHSGRANQAIRKYGEALLNKGWFWHALIRIGYISVTGGRNRRGSSAVNTSNG